jgi:hypothetical protein
MRGMLSGRLFMKNAFAATHAATFVRYAAAKSAMQISTVSAGRGNRIIVWRTGIMGLPGLIM